MGMLKGILGRFETVDLAENGWLHLGLDHNNISQVGLQQRNKRTMHKIHRQQLQQQIPGTSSILSQQGKKPNNSLVQDIWQFDHDPNDSFLTPIINEKLKKHHSSQDCAPNYLLGNNSNIKGDSNQYHSMLQESGVVPKYSNQYGLARVHDNANRDHEKERDSVREGDREIRGQANNKNGYINQLQRVLGINNGSKITPQMPKHPQNTSRPSAQHPNQTAQIEQPKLVPASQNPQISTSYTDQVTRDEDILFHRKVSNLNYIIRQTKQLMQLIKADWLQSELEEARSSIIKMEIDCRRLRISLRTNSSSTGSKFKTDKKIGVENASITAMQEYGYFQRNDSKSPISTNKPHNRSRHKLSLTPKQQKNSSNLIKIESNINNSENFQLYLISQIQKQKYNLQRLKQKQQKLNISIQNALARQRNRTSKSKNKQIKMTKSIKNIEELETSQTLDRKMEQKIQQKLKNNNSKDIGYRELLVEKRNVIQETMDKYKIHSDYRIGKLQQENNILKEQLKIVEAKIYETGMGVRTRTKHSISGQKSTEMSKKLLQRPLPPKRNPTNSNQQVLDTPYSQAQQLIPIESTNSKSKRKLFMRSPSHHPQYQQAPQTNFVPVAVIMPNNYQVRQFNLRRVCSHEVIGLTNTSIGEQMENMENMDSKEYQDHAKQKKNQYTGYLNPHKM